jgi:hypothetical protein
MVILIHTSAILWDYYGIEYFNLIVDIILKKTEVKYVFWVNEP